MIVEGPCWAGVSKVVVSPAEDAIDSGVEAGSVEAGVDSKLIELAGSMGAGTVSKLAESGESCSVELEALLISVVPAGVAGFNGEGVDG